MTPCIVSGAAVRSNGYAVLSIHGRAWKHHRYVYMKAKGITEADMKRTGCYA